MTARPRACLAVAVAATLLAAGCTDDGPEGGAPEAGVASPSDTAELLGDGVRTDVGVTRDACPQAVNPANGCIYLGTLSDLTVGPFAPLGVQFVAGQAAFWHRVNEAGGIGGFDVDVTEYVRDSRYDADEHVAQFRQVEPDVLALAHSLGTHTTRALLPLLDEADVLVVPASWWSGWSAHDVALPSGLDYCRQAVHGLDHAHEAFVEGGVTSLLVVHYPDGYGLDAVAGATAWAEANEVPFDPAVHAVATVPSGPDTDQDEVATALVEADPSVVYLATGPLEAAELVTKSVAAGYDGRFVGAVGTLNPALMQSPDLAASLPDRYRQVAPWEPFGADTEAHRAMAAALGGEVPANDAFTNGWVLQYPLLAAIEQAVADGDLTRAGLRAAAATLVVDYEGALPTRTYGSGPDAGAPGTAAPATAVVLAPDPEAPLGVSTAGPPVAPTSTVAAARCDDHDVEGTPGADAG